ncbi:nucleoside phosphorylase domain-containing protein [Colletotrichum cereale]|nr:nucleoside phosphorylase domain-containing protein [Colletotrichum cereale]
MQDGLRTYERYTVAVVCAIEFEMSAVRYMLDRQHPGLPTKEGDSNIYVLGELSGHDVVLACLPGSQGKGAAATVATNMARTFPSIKWRFFVGIGGGVPSNRHDIRLGDVVVRMPEGPYGGVVQYDLRKETDDGFVLKGFLTPPPPLLRGDVVKMRSDHLVSENKMEDFLSAMLKRGPRLSVYRRPSSSLDVLFEAGYAHRPENATCDECDEQKRVYRAGRGFEGPEIHYGLIASGDRVVKSTAKRGEVLRTVGDVLFFEMEAAGLMTEFSCIVIRDISDHADSHKNDDWQRYAAATAAACTKELLTYVDPTVVSAVSAVSAPSIDAAANRDRPVATFHGTGIQHSGSGNFSVGNDPNIGGRPGDS